MGLRCKWRARARRAFRYAHMASRCPQPTWPSPGRPRHGRRLDSRSHRGQQPDPAWRTWPTRSRGRRKARRRGRAQFSRRPRRDDHGRRGGQRPQRFRPYGAADGLGNRDGLDPAERPHAQDIPGNGPKTRSSRSPRASSSRPGPIMAAFPDRRLRATEGDRMRIVFRNLGSHPHSMHFHGIHAARMDGIPGAGVIGPGEEFTYEFDAFPFGCHLYHCHALPLKRHIHKGMYGTFVIDPDPAPTSRTAEVARSRLLGTPENARVAGDGDGDERLRHEFRRRERSLCGQH